MELFSDLHGTLPAAGVFLAVVLLVAGLGDLFGRRDRDAARRRLASPGDGGGRDGGSGDVSARFAGRGLFHRLVVDRLQDKLLSDDDAERSAVRRRLLQAGFYSPHVVPAYYALRLLLGGGVPVVLGPLASLALGHPSFGQSVSVVLALAAAAYLAPSIFLDRRIADRQQQVRESFPDALDLMLVCVEAGLALDAALARVAGELAATHPVLAGHFTLLVSEMRAGRSREEAWRAMSARIGIVEVSSLVTLLVQSEALGASASDALRAHAADLRLRRLLKAEEKAQQLTVKLTFPLMLMILPALMTVIGAPAFIQVYRTLLPAMHGAVQ